MQHDPIPFAHINQTLSLPYCWVCGSTDGLHDHHVVPRSYGGTDGPTVTICGSHHTLIHDLSLKKQEYWIVDEKYRDKLLYLIRVICRARVMWRALNIQKPLQINTTLPGVTGDKLRRIKLLSGSSSLENALIHAIDVAWLHLAPLDNK